MGGWPGTAALFLNRRRQGSQRFWRHRVRGVERVKRGQWRERGPSGESYTLQRTPTPSWALLTEWEKWTHALHRGQHHIHRLPDCRRPERPAGSSPHPNWGIFSSGFMTAALSMTSAHLSTWTECPEKLFKFFFLSPKDPPVIFTHWPISVSREA